MLILQKCVIWEKKCVCVCVFLKTECRMRGFYSFLLPKINTVISTTNGSSQNLQKRENNFIGFWKYIIRQMFELMTQQWRKNKRNQEWIKRVDIPSPQ